MINFTLNGRSVEVDNPEDELLLLVIRDELGLKGTKYGCGAAMCGACTVHVDGEPEFSCQLSVGDVAGYEVTTIEGLSEDASHPLQKAWIDQQVPQCGYCQSGQIMRAAALLSENPDPSRAEIAEYMAPNLCRCGTYNRIFKAVEQAAQEV
ncbi:(2Fe-2S)-binding protein (plasmid) [Roseobacter denitrificans]|uniref:Isoquinoline 1-oxidoreductase n=1 Tax=Roseobacter denitrificans (strain ATCC 33942 / OCh 114) TaxID=375451 RepID=Q07GL2_ROSDO|nr:(2Fe-2S)-binding protein [Roseobacter denitrificans]ABI93387.1 isoquinoline 1-oxidoreductase [Roseobacter denitrificans OCh 114]AVL51248.1 (2Fe-2S)-binding protein [Roseobacter denitrificans]SFG47587.1 isoquinoline 1-oxidoreductase, alpha subunit [Roseobacter denitrificans OCh 114]